MVRISLYGGPGLGKSTTAARLFAELKILWHTPMDPKVELVTEYIKEWAWLKTHPASWDEFYVLAKQIRREDVVLRQNHTHVITDSPLFMSLAYMSRSKSYYLGACSEAVRLFEEKYPSLHILLKRTVNYDSEGRYENLHQAMEMDDFVKNTLINYNVPFVERDPKEFDLIKQDAIGYITSYGNT